jgi:methyl-accepting chemotaxis protein
MDGDIERFKGTFEGARVSDSFKTLLTKEQGLKDLMREVIAAPDESTDSDNILAVSREVSASLGLRTAIDSENKRAAANEAVSEAKARVSATWMAIICLVAASCAIGVTLALGIARRPSRQLGGEPDYAVNLAGAIATGNLATPIETRSGDSTSLLFVLKDMRDKLAALVQNIGEASRSISIGAGELAQDNIDLSQRTAEQAASLQQTAASMDQMNSSVQSYAENARPANLRGRLRSRREWETHSSETLAAQCVS